MPFEFLITDFFNANWDFKVLGHVDLFKKKLRDVYTDFLFQSFKVQAEVQP